MPVNLLAICKQDSGNLVLKRVKVAADVQTQLESVFTQQEQVFLDGITEDVRFDGGWNPEANELLFTDLTDEASSIFQAAQQNVISLPEVNPRAFGNEGIRALAVLAGTNQAPRLLLQVFTAQQLLERRFHLLLSGDTFTKLAEPGFSIAPALAGIIEGGRIRFRQFSRIKLIFDLVNLYKEATESELVAFCDHAHLKMTDAETFKKVADQRMRKLVHAIGERGTFEKFTPQEIAAAASNEGFSIDLAENRIVIPTGKQQAKVVLQFLDNGLYRGPLGGELYISNSKRLYLAQ